MTALRPRFSIVSAVYNVEPYLPDFIASIEAQRFDLGRIEVIAVDDGSTDGSRGLLEAWAARRPELVRVLSQPNGGQGSARNLGLEHATGEWVTFTDPDDMLDRDFFRVVDRFATANPDLEILASRPILFDERTGRMSDTHPRRRQFEAGDRRVDLAREPNTYTGSATTLYRLDRIRELGLRFDPRIRPNFEDGHLAVRYILSLPVPEVGILRHAIYVYRKRAANDSSLQRSLSRSGRYSDVLRYGYLDLLEHARTTHGSVPAWLQQVVIYELSWYLSEEERANSKIQVPTEILPTFHALLTRILGYLEPEVIQTHTARQLRPVWMDILEHAHRPWDWHSAVAARTKVDRQAGLQRIGYRYVGSPPVEAFLVDDTAIEPTNAKTMSHRYYDRSLIEERVLWLPARKDLRMLLNGRQMTVVDGWPQPKRARAVSWRQMPWRGQDRWRIAWSAGWRRLQRLRSSLASAATVRVARLRPYRSTFRDAWVLTDRVYDANDNGERLFEYITSDRPDINAWFVIEKDTPDWARIRERHGSRLVAYGSFRWKMLMLNSRWLLSSHAGRPIAGPSLPIPRRGGPTWRYAFLQHGVIQSDLSRWLNRLDFDLFVVSSPQETSSIIADCTSYRYTAREVRLTGLPRFDRLLAKGRSFPSEDRDLVLIAPTWRKWFAFDVDDRTGRRSIAPTFWSSDFLGNWLTIVGSPEIAEAAAKRGLRLVFMPHPNMQHLLPGIELPPHVQGLTFADSDPQELYARTALLVTDYSSVAFDVAALGRPIVYFQFDRDRVLGGGHIGRTGYFDYEHDGFGPVAKHPAEAVRAIIAVLASGPQAKPPYTTRIDLTLVRRDGQACARVVAAVEELSRPYVQPAGTSSR